MNIRITSETSLNRRTFLGGAAALAASGMLSRRILGAEADKPNSVFNGVRIGCITYSYRGEISSAEDTLKALIEDGLSEVELMDGPIKQFAGIGGRKDPSDQLARCAELRKMYNDAGMNIHIHKTPFGKTDEAIDFNFQIAKALGATAITLERSEAMAKRLGHYYAGTKGKSPLPVLEKYHDRIVSLHLKDRTADGGNVPWGTGGTPIKEVLQLMKKEKWTFPGDIEVEYPIPKGSTAVIEVGKCVQYCKEALA